MDDIKLWCRGVDPKSRRKKENHVCRDVVLSKNVKSDFEGQTHSCYILNQLNVRRELYGNIVKRKLTFFGHTIRNKNLRLVSDIIEGKIEGRRGRGRPRIWYMDNVKQWTELNMRSVIQACHDREGWREIVRKAARAANAHKDDAA